MHIPNAVRVWFTCTVITSQVLLTAAPAIASELAEQPVVSDVQVVETASVSETSEPAEQPTEAAPTAVEVVESVSDEAVAEEPVATSEGAVEEVAEPVAEVQTVADFIAESVEESAPVETATETVTEVVTVPSESSVVTETVQAPQLTTDKDDYHPGETATIFGKLFGALQSFILKVFGSDDTGQNYTESTQTVTTDEGGSFSTTYTLDNLYRPFYEMTASTLNGDLLANGWFRDGAIGAYDQCSNDDGDGYASGNTGCRWINGNLNSNNSTYFEGDATVQRSWMRGYAPGSSHTLTFRYGTTKAGTHAYDYLTKWNYSEGWISLADRCEDITNCTGASVPETTFAIPDDVNAPPSIEPTGSPIRDMVMRGGTITGISAPTVVSGTYAGDSETEITVSFTVDPVDGANDMCTTSGQVTSCDIALWFGAHVGKTSEWSAHNGTTGAGFINGSPYHVQLAAEDGASIGNRDNQMQSNALPSQIIIRKVTDPVSDPQVFSFAKTGNGNGYSNFTLTGGNSNTQVVTPKNNQNTYVITEGAVAQWGLTNITCQDNSSVTTTTVNLANRQVTIVLDIDASSIVDCTFTNTKIQNGTIVVDKVTVPAGDPQSFSFDAAGGAYADFSLTHAATPNSQVLVAGNYSVSETVPAGWDQTSASCVSSIGDTETVGSIELDANETVTCTFTNTKQLLKQPVQTCTGAGDLYLYQGDQFQTINKTFTVGAGLNQVLIFTRTSYLTSLSATVNAVPQVPAVVFNSAVPFPVRVYSLAVAPGDVVAITGTATGTLGARAIQGYLVQNTAAPVYNAGTIQIVYDGLATNTMYLLPGSYNFVVFDKYSLENDATDDSRQLTVSIPSAFPLTVYTKPSPVPTEGAVVGSYTVGSAGAYTMTVTTPPAVPFAESVYWPAAQCPGGTIIVDKVTVPAADQQLFDFTPSWTAPFQLADATAPHNSGTLVQGTYSVSETVPAGWDLTSATCSDGSPVNAISLQPNETVTCTFTNTKRGHIIVDKVTNPSGDTQSFDFTSSWGAFGLTDAATPVDSGALVPGTYNVAETVPAGWDLTSATCSDGSNPASINLAAGETVTCTFTNTKRGNIIVDKVTDPAGDTQSFSFTAGGVGYSNFALTDAAAPNNQELVPGAYSVSETVPAGWDLLSATCVSSIQDNETPASLELDPGETITCTFTNQKDAIIIVEKQTLPDGDLQSFSFTASYDGDGFSLADGGQNNSGDLNPGTYSVSETVPQGWNQSGVTCSDGSDPASINLEAGETVTCVFTNTKRGTINIVKNTIGDNGTFNFTTTGGNGLPAGFSIVTSGNTGSQSYSIVPGTYTISESVPANWVLDGATCDDGSALDDIQVAPGETVTCTFVNRAQGKIRIIKNTQGGDDTFDFTVTGPTASNQQLTTTGGTAQTNLITVTAGGYSVAEVNVPAGWDMTGAVCDSGTPQSFTVGAGDIVTCTFTNVKRGKIIVEKQTDPQGDEASFSFTASYDGDGFSLSDDGQNDSGLLVPGVYSVAETVPAGWDLESVVCSDQSAPNAINLDAGETVTCVFTNEKDAFIIIEKQTDPEGDPQVFDFNTSYGTGDADLSDGQTANSGDLDPGTYSVSETAIAGWDLTSATCSDGSPVNAIDLQAGETVTCTFNNQKDAYIIVEKQTLPDGDSEVFGFTASYDGDGFSLSDDQQNNSGDLAPGSYNVAETVPAGWDLTNIVCTSSNQDVEESSGIDLQAGETVTCVFTNTKRGNIVIEKQTLPNGDPAEFTFTGDVAGSLSDGEQASQEVVPGSYSSVETVPVGWDLTSIVCDDQNSSGNTGTATASFNVQPGETVTCVFTNTKRGKIIIEKQTLPADSSQSFNFTGEIVTSLSDNGTAEKVVVPGTYYVAESVPAGWNITNITCDDSDSSGLLAEAEATFNVSPGETVKCTFENTQKGHIIVDKVTDPAGDTTSFSFDAFGGAGAYADFNLTDAAQPNDQELVPGKYSVEEFVPQGWDLISATCDQGETIDDIDVEPGETVTCTFTNQADANIIVVKQTYPDGNQQVFDFSASYDGDGFALSDGQQNDSGDLNPGTYSVSETIPAGWAQTGATCSNESNPASIGLSAGETVTCTFMNVKPDAKITLTPLTATNEVDDEHVVIATVLVDSGSGFVSAVDGTLVTFTLPVNTAGATFVGGNTCLTVSGSCSVTINSASAGLVELHAATTVNPLGVTLNRETDGANGNSVNAAKTYVDASIALDPLEAVNAINDPHTITATVTKNDGTGVTPAVGETVVFSISGLATFVGNDNDCVTNGSGQCSIQIVSSTVGSNTINATTTFLVGGVSLTRATDGDYGPAGTGSVAKQYVNARISITPSQATNQVDEPHTFTITVEEDTGSGFTPVENALVDVVVSPAPDGGLNEADCNDGTNASGQCSATINSSVAGVFTARARSVIVVGGVQFMLQTNGQGDSSGPAVKTYVDAKISVTPEQATNNVNDPHTVTATVLENLGVGFVAAANETVTFTLPVNTAGATFVGGIDTCITDVLGQCSVQINSATPGSVEIHASVDAVVGSEVIHRESDSTHGSSGNGNKLYVAGKIIVVKQTLPDGSSQSFEFDPSYATNFFLNDGQDNNSGWIAPGSYSVAEVNVPAGWDMTSATCDDGSPVNAISLQADEIVTCTFENTQRGHLIVQKTTLPVGNATVFNITASGTGSITGSASGTVTDAADYDYEVTPGTYSVTETVPTGWDKTVDTCQNVVVPAGETVYCGFTNVKRATVIIVKDAQPNDAQDFQFNGDLGGFTLDDDSGVQDAPDPSQWQNSQTFLNVVPNQNYTLHENQPSQYWKLASVICSEGAQFSVDLANGNLTITPQPGQEVTCTFVNEKLSPTRTQGFWQTHTAYTTGIFQTNLASVMPIGTAPHKGSITTAGQLFGAFYSNISKTTTNAQRTAIDKARMQLVQQLVAAKLNCAAFGCTPGVQAMIAAADVAYAGTSASAILASAAAMDAYNNSGDTIIIGNAGKATPKTSQNIADKPFWNLP